MDADPGHYEPAAGATEQSACPVGTFQPLSGQTSCAPATPGHYVATTGSNVQTLCSPGYYQPNIGAVSCIAAASGYFVANYGAIEQTPCPVGTTSGPAATACTPTGYTFSGFFSPVSMTALNRVKAGQSVPIKFSLGGNFGLNILATGSPASAPIACDTGEVIGAVEPVGPAGSSGLSYKSSTDQYTYVWKTDKAWANSCRVLTVTLDDGSVHSARFQFTG